MFYFNKKGKRRKTLPCWRFKRLRFSGSIHSAHIGSGGGGLFFFRQIRDQRVAGEHHGRDARGVLKSGTSNLSGVDNACGDEVFILVGKGVVTEVSLTVANLFSDDAAVFTGVVGDLRDRSGASAKDDVVTDLFVVFKFGGLDETRRVRARRRRRGGRLLQQPRESRGERLQREPSFLSFRLP